MTAGFKHRLLGATILILAGIIFLPDLLDGEKQVVKEHKRQWSNNND